MHFYPFEPLRKSYLGIVLDSKSNEVALFVPGKSDNTTEFLSFNGTHDFNVGSEMFVKIETGETLSLHYNHLAD